MICNLGSLGALIYGAINTDKYGHALWVSALGFHFAFPIALELLLNIKAFICRSSLSPKAHSIECCGNKNDCFPIVYSPRYNITLCGLEKIHPFDSVKYRRVYNDLWKL